MGRPLVSQDPHPNCWQSRSERWYKPVPTFRLAGEGCRNCPVLDVVLLLLAIRVVPLTGLAGAS
jgi:hypothetical protein